MDEEEGPGYRGKAAHNMAKERLLDNLAPVDNISGLVMCHLSFLLNMFLPRWIVQSPMKMFRELIRIRHEHIIATNQDNVMCVYVGSFFDGMNVPNFTHRSGVVSGNVSSNTQYDMDILLLVRNLCIAYDIIDDIETYPGYFRIIDSSVNSNLRNVSEAYLEKLRDIDGARVVQSGPALSMLDDNLFDFEHVDYVPTFQMISWPASFLSWVARPRRFHWPTQEMIFDITDECGYFVNKPHPTSIRPDNEWRYSFAMAEQKLLHSVSETQRQSFIIYKTLVKHILSPGMCFTSYCLKTTFFWTLESTPSHVWDGDHDGLAVGVIALLDKLIYFLADHCLPMYFIPENNLIEDISAPIIKQNLKMLISCRADPLKGILEFNDKYYFTFASSSTTTLTERFTPIIKATSATPSKFTDCLQLHHDVLSVQLVDSLMLHNLPGSLDIVRHMYYIRRDVKRSTVPFLQYMAWRFMETQAMLGDMRLGDEQCIGYILGYLATVMDIEYHEPTNIGDNADKQLGAKMVLGAYQQALKYGGQKPITRVCFARFLMNHGKPDLAQLYLENVVSLDAHNETLVTGYLFALRNTLDPTLSYMFQIEGFHAITCRMLAYYLLITICQKYDTAKMKSFLQTFERESDKNSVLDGDWRNSSFLVAYTYLAVDDLSNAIRMLEKKGFGGDKPQEVIESYRNYMATKTS